MSKSVFIVRNMYSLDEIISVHATVELAFAKIAELIEADKQHWLNTFGDNEGDFDNYEVDEWEVN